MTEEELVERVKRRPGGWVQEMGIRILSASADEVTCEWDVTERHHQGRRPVVQALDLLVGHEVKPLLGARRCRGTLVVGFHDDRVS